MVPLIILSIFYNTYNLYLLFSELSLFPYVLHTHQAWKGFPGDTEGKGCERLRFNPGSGRVPGEGNG